VRRPLITISNGQVVRLRRALTTSSSGSSTSADTTVPTTPAGGTITHGFQITAANTGHTAYLDPTLGRLVTDADLTVHTGLVSLSDFVGNGGTLTRHWFKGGLQFDRSNVTLTACRFDGGIAGYYSGTHYPFTVNWCTSDTPGGPGDDAIHFQDYTAYRCRLGGNSDGGKFNGGCTITECYVRCEMASADDHNDGFQAVGSYKGNTVTRCNIDCRPTNGIIPGGSGGPNAALFVADGSTGLHVWTDNFLAGGGYVMRCYDGTTYNVQGNWILDQSWGFGPVDRAVIPQSNLTWGTVRPNLVVTSAGAQVSVVAAP
jgi:hypothetical protein